MIVWLASYPRSENTLLRTVLKSCFGFGSVDSEAPGANEIQEQDHFVQATGHRRIAEGWAAFYRRASASRERYFVKSHRPPQDTQPCIYIVRDGRKATLSYYYYSRRFRPDEPKSLLELVLGNDDYGHWTSHYRHWQSHRRPSTLLVRYEALRNDPGAEIARIANFLGIDRPWPPWKNPFSELHGRDPDFFRSGAAEWQPDPLWTPYVEDAFQAVHAGLMGELGYRRLDPAKDFAGSPNAYDEFIRDLAALSERVMRSRTQAEQDAAAMLAEIELLSMEAGKRLALIHQLSAVAEERLVKIGNLAAEAERRRELIEKLHSQARQARA